MKKIVSWGIIFVFSMSFYEVQASLQQNLQELFDNLVALEQVLLHQKPKTEKEIEQEFEQLLKKTNKVVQKQRNNFDHLINFLKEMDDTKKLFKIKRFIEEYQAKSISLHNKLIGLTEIINKYTYDLDIKEKFGAKVIQLYQKIKDDWNQFNNFFNEFLLAHEKSAFFIKEYWTQDAKLINFFGDKTIILKNFFFSMQNDIEKITDRAQRAMNEYSELWQK